MNSICFYFQVHQPFRLANYNFDQIGKNDTYENINLNKDLIDVVSDTCYLPANAKILDLIKQTKGKFKVSFSISGTALEQFELYRPDVLKSFKKLVDTGSVEILAETYYHSLSSLYSPKEFKRQVTLHTEKIKKHFNVTPVVFRNTELIFSNEIAQDIAKMGYKGILCEGVDSLLNGRSTTQVFASPRLKNFGLLLKSRSLSDDIALRFSDKQWSEFPLSAAKYAGWIHSIENNDEIINLFMDYETFGKKHTKETGIFDFLKHFPEEILKKKGFEFTTPTQVLSSNTAKEVYDVPSPISWADAGRDLSPWLENKMQLEALKKIYSMEEKVMEKGTKTMLSDWGKLQSSDHFYHMSTRHSYLSPFDSPYDSHIYYMNIVSDVEELLTPAKELIAQVSKSIAKKEATATKKTASPPVKEEAKAKSVKKVAATTVKKTVSPAKKEIAVKKAAAPVKKTAPATKKVKEKKPAVKKTTAVAPKKEVPVKKATAPAKKTAVVAKKVKEPAVKKATVVKKEKESPAKKVSATKKVSTTKEAKAPVKKAAKKASAKEITPAKKVIPTKKSMPSEIRNV